MNNKGKEDGMKGMGILIVAFVGIVVAVLLYQAVNPYVGDMTGANSNDVVNLTVTMPAVGSSTELTGFALKGTPIVTNFTTGAIVPTSNYSITEGVGTNGVKTIILTHTGAGALSTTEVNVSYEYYPDGYIDNAGGRGMVLLIPIFAALAIVIIALSPTLRSGLLDMIN